MQSNSPPAVSPPHPPRPRHHHKRRSSLRVSVDSTLPAYTRSTSHSWASSTPNLHRSPSPEKDIPSDQPPEYPDSAEEADADTDGFASGSEQQIYVRKARPSTKSADPRRGSTRPAPNRTRSRRSVDFPQHTSSPSTDPYLDSLLERSIHALEMSNTLLMTSRSAQSSFANVITSDSAAEDALHGRAKALSIQLQDTRARHSNWTNELDGILRGFEDLVSGAPIASSSSLPNESPVSRSLPNSSLARRVSRTKRVPSLNLGESKEAQLKYSNHGRSDLIGTAPRALTLYVNSTEDPSTIALPSTLGLRSTPSRHPIDELPPEEEPPSSRPGLPHTPLSEPAPERNEAGSSKAVKSLTFLIDERPTPRHVTPSPSMKSRRWSRSSSSSQGTVRAPSKDDGKEGLGAGSPTPPHALRTRSSRSSVADSPARSRESSLSRSRSTTPKRAETVASMPQLMSSIEELSSSASSSSDGPPDVARTVQSLRRILDDAPRSAPPAPAPRLPPPRFTITPAPAPEAGTSNATASVSRLFTKGTHHTATRAPSPPRQSALKRPGHSRAPSESASLPPTPTPSLLSISSLAAPFKAASDGGGGSSGRSTPRRIAFAELPESYASTKPAGASAEFARARTKRRKSSSRRSSDASTHSREGSVGGWWTGWLLGAAGTPGGSGLNFGAARAAQNIEERTGRTSASWTTRSGLGSSLEDWGV